MNPTKHAGIQRKYKFISIPSEHQSRGKISCYINSYAQSYGSIHNSMFTAFVPLHCTNISQFLLLNNSELFKSDH